MSSFGKSCDIAILSILIQSLHYLFTLGKGSRKLSVGKCSEKIITNAASTSLPTNDNAPIWSMPIEIHRKFLLGRLLLSHLHTLFMDEIKSSGIFASCHWFLRWTQMSIRAILKELRIAKFPFWFHFLSDSWLFFFKWIHCMPTFSPSKHNII